MNYNFNTVEDFAIEDQTIVGFSDTGYEKLSDSIPQDIHPYHLAFPEYTKDGVEITDIAPEAFMGCDLSSYAIDTWGKIVVIGDNAFKDGIIGKLPDTWGEVTTIGDDAFSMCYLGTFVYPHLPRIPAQWGTVESLGKGAFFESNVNILPQDWGKITVVPESCFRHNRSLVAVPLQGLEKIEQEAFFDCGVMSVPSAGWKNLQIGIRAFARCTFKNFYPDAEDISHLSAAAFLG